MHAPTIKPYFHVMAVVAALALAGCGGKPEKDAAGDKGTEQAGADAQGKDGKDKAPEAVPVEVAIARTQTVNASYAGTANLDAPEESVVTARTSGIMVAQLAEEGDFVRQGQVLARIDPARARLEVQRNQATVNKLSNNYRRAQELLAQKLISAEAHDQIRFDLESARASLELSKLELAYTDITAPITGVVAQRMIKQGNLVALNAPVFRIVDNQRLEAVMNVPERELATLKPGLPVQLRVDAIPGKMFEGRIDRVAPVVDVGSGTFRVVSAFQPGPLLKAGMFGRIEVVYDERPDALTIPRTALLDDESEAAVFVVRGKKAERVVLGTGFMNGELVEVTSGLKPGDRVVTAGKVAIRDGIEVQVITPGVKGDGVKNGGKAAAAGN